MSDDRFTRLLKPVNLADGGMGTMIQAAGLPAGGCPENLNLTHPDGIQDIHRLYIDAGSTIILTNTFGGSRLKLQRSGLDTQLAEVNRAGARVARAAAGSDVLVAVSIGPTGELPEPYGTINEATFVEVFSEQIAATVEEDVDLIWIETMSDLTEACAAVTAAKAVCDLPIVTTMTFNHGPRGYHTIMGISPGDAARALSEAGTDYAGANCGLGSDDIIEIIRAMHEAMPDGSFVAKPNAGMPELVEGQTRYPETPEWMSARVPGMIEAGARFIGGCCGTTPDHLRVMAQSMQTG